MFKRLTVMAFVFGMTALAPPVVAQSTQACGPRAQFVDKLEHKYNEVSRGVGLSSPTQVVEFWSSSETGTFSVFVTYPNGISCILATGQSWTEAMVEPATVKPNL